MTDEEVAALKARIAQLEEHKSRRRLDGRGLTAWALLIIAAILFPVALTAFWGQRTLTDTQRYVATVGPLAQDSTVQQAVATKVTTVIVNQLDAQTRVGDLLQNYPKLQPLAGPIASGVNTFVGNEVTKLVDSEQFAQLWITVNTELQKALIAALSSQPTGAVSIQGDQVVLDTGDLITAVKTRLVDRGLAFAANLPVPAAADRQIVLLTSPQIRQARVAYALGQPVAQWLIYVTLLLFIITVLISRKRARMTTAVGIAMIIGAVVIRLAMAYGQSQIDLTLSGTAFAGAQQAFFTILTAFLLLAVRAALALGLVLVIAGWFLSGTKTALSARRFLGGVLSNTGGRASGTAIAPVGAWFARTRVFWRFLIGGVAAVVLLSTSPVTGAVILWTAIVAILALAVVELLAAAGASSITDIPDTPDVAATVDSGGPGPS
ncbi:MAG: hypothetical protein ABI468_07565 [Candidatus Nanopelagicales bacterium]